MDTGPSYGAEARNANNPASLDEQSDLPMYRRFMAAGASDQFHWPYEELDTHRSSKDQTRLRKARRARNARSIKELEASAAVPPALKPSNPSEPTEAPDSEGGVGDVPPQSTSLATIDPDTFSPVPHYLPTASSQWKSAGIRKMRAGIQMTVADRRGLMSSTLSKLRQITNRCFAAFEGLKLHDGAAWTSGVTNLH